MDNKIKEMLEEMKSILDTGKDINGIKVDGCGFHGKGLKLLYDYIINLENENQILKDNNKNMQEEMLRTWERASNLINNIQHDELHHYKVLRDIKDILKEKETGYIETYDKLEEYIEKELKEYE